MSLIQSIKDYMATYEGLKDDAPLWVNYLGTEATQYGIIPLPGPQVLEEYLNGSSLRAYPFAFQSMERTADELERIEDHEFFEALAAWFESQTRAGILPTLDSGKTAEAIEATGGGYLFEQGQSQTGVFQIQCRLVYEQEGA
jgi:hypothetical protein